VKAVSHHFRNINSLRYKSIKSAKGEIIDYIGVINYKIQSIKSYTEWSNLIAPLCRDYPTSYITLLLHLEVKGEPAHQYFTRRDLANFPNIFIQHFNIPTTTTCWSIKDIFAEAQRYNPDKIWEYLTKEELEAATNGTLISLVTAPSAPSPSSSLSLVAKFLLDSSLEGYKSSPSDLVCI
jgi:hypothetical protein